MFNAMENKPTLPIEIWRKIGEYGNTRMVINYEVKTLEESIYSPDGRSAVGGDDGELLVYVETSGISRKAIIAYADLSYQLLFSCYGKTYPLVNIHSGCLFVAKGLQLIPQTINTPDSEPYLCLDHTKRIQRIRNEIDNDYSIALWLSPEGMASCGSFGKGLNYEKDEITIRFMHGASVTYPFPKAKLLEMVDALEDKLQEIKD